METKIEIPKINKEVLPVAIGKTHKTPSSVSLVFSKVQSNFIYNLSQEQDRSFKSQCMSMIRLVMEEYGFVEEYYSELMELSKGLKQTKNELGITEIQKTVQPLAVEGNDENQKEKERAIDKNHSAGNR